METCVTPVPTPDVPTGADLVLTVCTFDVELISLVTGGESYTVNSASAMAIGTQTPSPVESPLLDENERRLKRGGGTEYLLASRLPECDLVDR